MESCAHCGNQSKAQGSFHRYIYCPWEHANFHFLSNVLPDQIVLCVCVRRREEGGEYSTSNCWHFHYNQYFSLSGVHRYPPTVVETKWKIVSKKPLQHILEIRNLSETQHRGHSGTLWRCSDGLEATLDWFIHFTSQLMYGIHKHSVYCINKGTHSCYWMVL